MISRTNPHPSSDTGACPGPAIDYGRLRRRLPPGGAMTAMLAPSRNAATLDCPTGMNASRPRSLASLYIAGPLSMGYADFYTFVIPLYGLSLGFDASQIGILVGARSIVGMFLSI